MSVAKHILSFVLIILFAGCAYEEVIPETDVDDSYSVEEDQTAMYNDYEDRESISMDAPLPAKRTFSLKVSDEDKAEVATVTEDEPPKNDESPVEQDDDTHASQTKMPERFVNSLRVWKDNQGLFSTNAELLAVGDANQFVTLLKANGKIVQVPFHRLSRHDQNFVTQFMMAVESNSLLH